MGSSDERRPDPPTPSRDPGIARKRTRVNETKTQHRARRPGRWIWMLALLAAPVGGWLIACGDGPPQGEPTITTRAGTLAWSLWLEPDPPRQKGNTLWLVAEDAQGDPLEGAALEGAEVALRYRMPAMGAMPEMKGQAEVRPSPSQGGLYRLALDFPMGGTWTLDLSVAHEGTRAHAEYTLTVGSRGLRQTGAGAAGTVGHRALAPEPPTAATGAREPVELPPTALAPLRAALVAYEEARALLAQDRLDGLSPHAGRLVRSLERAGAGVPPGDAPRISRWLDEGVAAARALGAATGLEAARQAFGEVSRFLVALAGADPRLAEGWHVFECPMTETFPKWMQPSEELANPYMGPAMPSCGNATDWTVPRPRSMSEIEAHVTHVHEGDLSHYTCSMHPSVRSQEPGTCPLCSMDLVPVTREEVETGVIRVDAARRQAIGVRTAPVRVQPLSTTIRAVGTVTYDETRLSEVSLKVEGWIGRLFVDEPGQAVRRGEPLFTLYSPDLLTAQQELLIATRAQQAARDTEAPDRADYLAAAARRRLALWDLSEGQIDEIARTGEPLQYVPILSPTSGYVVEKNVVEGAAVKPGQALYRIAGLDGVWVEAEVYESELPLVRVGQPVEVTFPYLPGRAFKGQVDYVYPYLQSRTRTGTVRVELANPDLALKPDMYANVLLRSDLGERLVVPEEAVIYAGPRRLVFVDLGEGRLQPREIEVGAKTAEGYEVLSGLAPGDVVVTSGNFLIAAESRLKSATEQW